MDVQLILDKAKILAVVNLTRTCHTTYKGSLEFTSTVSSAEAGQNSLVRK